MSNIIKEAMKHTHTNTWEIISAAGLKKLNSPQMAMQSERLSLKKKSSEQTSGWLSVLLVGVNLLKAVRDVEFAKGRC